MNEPKKKFKAKFTKTGQKDYDSIKDPKLRRGINRIIDDIEENPYQFKKLWGPLSHLRSASTFSFRVLYQIDENGLLIVWVVSIDNRKDVYR